MKRLLRSTGLLILVVAWPRRVQGGSDPDAFLKAISTPPSVKKTSRRNPELTPPAKPPVPVEAEVTEGETETKEASSRLLGDEALGRGWLSKRGLEFDATYRGELVSNFSGGLEKRATYLGMMDLILARVDGESSKNGFSFMLHALAAHGGAPSSFVGDAQVSSNIEAASTFKLYQAWIEKKTQEGAASLRLGVYDLNSEFYVTDSSLQLFNSSFGIGMDMSQSGTNGPSIYPTPGLGARVRLGAGPWYVISAAIEGSPGHAEDPSSGRISLSSDEGVLLASEFGYAADSKYALGVWAYTTPMEGLAADGEEPADEVASGAYVLFDQKMDDRMSLFVRVGWASGAVHEYGAGYTAGLARKGLIPGRDEDLASFGVAYARASSRFREIQAASGVALASGETAFEFNYRFEVAPGLAIQPDLQYIRHPSADASLSHAFVGTLRFELGL